MHNDAGLKVWKYLHWFPALVGKESHLQVTLTLNSNINANPIQNRSTEHCGQL